MIARIALRANGGGNYFASPKKGIRFVKTGCHMLDLALGGGWAEGRIANIIGDKSTGKTLLCTEAAANFAVKYPKGKIRYRESEAAFDQAYARALGMPIDRIDFGDPMETVEDLFEDLQRIVTAAKGPELYICDSLDALSDRAEMKRDMNEGSYGAEKAKKMSQLFRRLIRDLETAQVTVIIVSQIRDKMNAMFGRKITRTGGRAMDFYASHVLMLAHIGRVTQTIRGQKRAVAVKVKAMVDKNKVSLPFREAEFKIRFGYGIDDAEACLEFLKSINRLKDVNVSPTKLREKIEDLAAMSNERFARDMGLIRSECSRHWYEIEKSLLPTRTKYGAF
jgi:recombination protein RecA